MTVPAVDHALWERLSLRTQPVPSLEQVTAEYGPPPGRWANAFRPEAEKPPEKAKFLLTAARCLACGIAVVNRRIHRMTGPCSEGCPNAVYVDHDWFSGRLTFADHELTARIEADLTEHNLADCLRARMRDRSNRRFFGEIADEVKETESEQ